MTHEDERRFLVSADNLSPLKIIHNTFADESKMEVLSLQPVDTLGTNANLSLVNAANMRIQYEFFPSSGNYRVNLVESEVVQFNRCKPIKTWLANGRLWFEEKSRQGKKSAAFSKWANSLLNWVRNNYERHGNQNFVGPNALELARAGKLKLGPPIEPQISLEERKRILGVL